MTKSLRACVGFGPARTEPGRLRPLNEDINMIHLFDFPIDPVAIVRNIDVHTGHTLRAALVPKRYQPDHVVLILGLGYRADERGAPVTAARILAGLAARTQKPLVQSEAAV